jgi:hypothetical protein
MEISNDLPEWVQGDSHRIRQVLLNLVGNAVKFTERGAVAVRATLAEREALTGPMMVQFSVSDTGIGVPEAQRELIFEPFRQADGSTARKFGGTGLGLTISHKLVTLMNGRMWFESREGAGSTFFFVIPLSPAAAQASRPRPARSSSPSNGSSGPHKKLAILVGEDHLVNQRLILRLLELGEIATSTPYLWTFRCPEWMDWKLPAVFARKNRRRAGRIPRSLP